MKVHITIRREALQDEDASRRVLDAVRELADVDEAKLRRFARHGILTATVSDEALARLRDMSEIEAVEPDEQVHTLSD